MIGFLVDAFVAVFPSLISIAIFCIGLSAAKTRKKRENWWTAGTVVFGLYAIGNIASAQRNYVSIAIGIAVVVGFYFVMAKGEEA